MSKIISFNEVLESIKNGECIKTSNGNLNYVKDIFVISDMFGKVDFISDEKAFEYINEYVRENNLDAFLYKVEYIINQSNKKCEVLKKPNWFRHHILMDNPKYKIELKRCNSQRIDFSDGDYIYGLHITRLMKPYNSKINFERKLSGLEYIKRVSEDFYECEMDRELGMLYNHNINVNFDKIFHSEEDETALIQLICDTINNAF